MKLLRWWPVLAWPSITLVVTYALFAVRGRVCSVAAYQSEWLWWALSCMALGPRFFIESAIVIFVIGGILLIGLYEQGIWPKK